MKTNTRKHLVALRKESVDRNKGPRLVGHGVRMSLSARRAWIEIIHRRPHYFYLGVALRKESVDRNLSGADAAPAKHTSLSARRAWIEIYMPVIL